MADDVKIELDANLEQELHEFPVVTAKAEEVANDIANEARLFAPVETGRYRDGIVVEKSNKSKSGVYVVRATDQKSSWIEFGNEKQPAQFPLRRAVEALGYKFKKGK